MDRSTSRIAVGSVESRTKKRRPAGAGNVRREYLGREARTAHAQQYDVLHTGISEIAREKSRIADASARMESSTPIQPSRFAMTRACSESSFQRPGCRAHSFWDRVGGPKASSIRPDRHPPEDLVKFAAPSGAWDPLGRGIVPKPDYLVAESWQIARQSSQALRRMVSHRLDHFSTSGRILGISLPMQYV